MRSNRRSIIPSLALGAALLLAACGGGTSNPGPASTGKPFEGMTLVVGGMQQNIIDTLKPSVDAQFKELTGATIQWNAGQAPDNLAKLLAAKGGPPPFDAVFLDSTTQTQAIQAKVVQKIDPKDIPGSQNLPSEAWANPGYGPGWILIRLGSCINTQQFQQLGLDPKGGIDLWFDPKLNNKIDLPAVDNFYWGAAMPAIADNYGVAYSNPGPVMDRFAKVKPLALFTSSGDGQSAMTSGKAALVPLTDGRCLNLKLGGKPVDFVPLNIKVKGKTYPWVRLVDTWDVPTGVTGKKAALAKQFIGFVEGEPIMPVVKAFGYIPADKKVLAEAQQVPQLQGLIPAQFQFSETYNADYQKFLSNQQAWIDAWNKTFQK